MKKKTIFIAEDDPDVMETLRFRLEQEGYEVFTAVNGWEALGGLRVTEPDLLLLDVMMPKENGYRVSRMIKEDEQTGKRTSRVPIILLTARNLEGDLEREKMFMEFSQADVVIYKPFELDNLLTQIKALLKEDKA